MEKQKRWHFYLILGVILLTIYNIFPTTVYYFQPLKKPVDELQAMRVGKQIVERVNALEEDALGWVQNYVKYLQLKAAVKFSKHSKLFINVEFSSAKDASLFRQLINEAGTRIPFPPAQIELSLTDQEASQTVTLKRKLNFDLDSSHLQEVVSFIPKRDPQGKVSKEYRDLVYQRLAAALESLSGATTSSNQLYALAKQVGEIKREDLLLKLAREIVEVRRNFSEGKLFFSRYMDSLIHFDGKEETSEHIVARFRDHLKRLASRFQLDSEQLDQEEGEELKKWQQLQEKVGQLQEAEGILAHYDWTNKVFAKPAFSHLIKTFKQAEKVSPLYEVVPLENNLFFSQLEIDWDKEVASFSLQNDLKQVLDSKASSEDTAYQKEFLEQLLITFIAELNLRSGEDFIPEGSYFKVALNQLPASQSILGLSLDVIAKQKLEQIQGYLSSWWNPQHSNLSKKNFPIWNKEEFLSLGERERALGILLLAPSISSEENKIGEIPLESLKRDSIYVILRGFRKLLQQYEGQQDKSSGKQFITDFQRLQKLMQSEGFVGYTADRAFLSKEFADDYIFELNRYFTHFLSATREDFRVYGDRTTAVLEFTDYEQRLLRRNDIETRVHEELLNWRDQYRAAQVDTTPGVKFFVPSPNKNVFWENLKLNLRKYFRGDERKVLKWGLDLAGGKQVRIGLRDKKNQPVTAEEDLKQAVNELYTRVNKMGVSEVSIRIENQNIILDFPGSQAFSAHDLIKGSAMYFHVVNEKFGRGNAAIKEHVNTFLQEVWNEAVVTNRIDSENINRIAWEHLGAGEEEPTRLLSEAAKELRDADLVLADKDGSITNQYDDTISYVARYRGEDRAEWYGQSHPLMFVFRNYALEGAQLDSVNTGYDQTEGHSLVFSVRSSYIGGQQGNPRNDFYTWTSQMSEDNVAGTLREEYSAGRGWRMAVILNGEVISAPNLRGALKTNGSISGRFTQREVEKLAADLKAGSMSFTPKILSEQNISPDLGNFERNRGLAAAFIGLVLVIGVMISYYRFAGIVASVAILFNLLIMWGVLQNLDAALTLPGIAGIILTIGMAVDANVLVFERIQEEFAKSKRISSSMHAGYRKAFTAIVDSNLTTIIAAFILIQFDSGPIKGFATTLIIGIVSSMFTALFMTRYFFIGWIKKTQPKELKMANWIKPTSFDFLKYSRIVVSVFAVIILIGSALFYKEKQTIFGMDFTGGYSLQVDLEPQDGVNYRSSVTQALEDAGASSTDVEIRTLNQPHQLKIELGMGLEEEGAPFYQMIEQVENQSSRFAYENNPRIAWIVNALKKADLQPQVDQLEVLDQQWTVMSGQFSETMRYQALLAVFFALVSILLYTTYRFEFQYAMSAIIALAHDVVIAVAVFAFMHFMGFSVQIDLEIIGAIMTIIGYSLNDTIIVFDRIREDRMILKKLNMRELINHALNKTLSRTIMTSVTTLVVLVSLVLFGGQAIFGFSFVMLTGVIFGTCSTLFIATPLLLYFSTREQKKIPKH